MYKEKEMAQLMETERKRAVKPPMRYLPEVERNELLNVRAIVICFKHYFLFFIVSENNFYIFYFFSFSLYLSASNIFADFYLHFSLRD